MHVDEDDAHAACSTPPTTSDVGRGPDISDTTTDPPVSDDSTPDAEYANKRDEAVYSYDVHDAPTRWAPTPRLTPDEDGTRAGETHSYTPDPARRVHTIEVVPNEHCHAEDRPPDADTSTAVPPDSDPDGGDAPVTAAPPSPVPSRRAIGAAVTSHRQSDEDAIDDVEPHKPPSNMCAPITSTNEPPVDNTTDGRARDIEAESGTSTRARGPRRTARPRSPPPLVGTALSCTEG